MGETRVGRTVENWEGKVSRRPFSYLEPEISETLEKLRFSKRLDHRSDSTSSIKLGAGATYTSACVPVLACTQLPTILNPRTSGSWYSGAEELSP